jgi:ubiquinol-cytochrome c reductase cytochrome b subunit
LAPFFRNKKSAAGYMLESRLLKTEYFNISGYQMIIRISFFPGVRPVLTILSKMKLGLLFCTRICKLNLTFLNFSSSKTPLKLKFHVGSANQQVTKALSKQVGTSETLRPLTKLNNSFSHKILKFNKKTTGLRPEKNSTNNMNNQPTNKKNMNNQPTNKKNMNNQPTNNSCFSNQISNDPWNDYLAGLIDGDGSLLISKAGYASLEITMDIYDELALNKVKQKLGGSVKKRSGANAFRYRLHNKAGMAEVIERINGRIRNSKRIVQLQKLCQLYNVPYQKANPITISNSWFAGFFDADGTLGYSWALPSNPPEGGGMKNGWPQLVVSASNKNAMDLRFYKEIFGGTIRLDSNSNTHKWEISSKEAVVAFCDYLKNYPIHSHKKNRIFLIPQFLKLRSCSAYAQAPDSLLYKAWVDFETNWNDFSL